jgi:DNA helicase-2/ATP-dependent DNA helicase PcrA
VRGLTETPERLFAGLNDAQREAVQITRGPLVILAGAGSGKTRVISHRTAFAVEAAAVHSDQVLLVTFTDKAATEMVARMTALGHPDVSAKTFHAAALAQLRYFWPSRHDGEPLPKIVESKGRLLHPLATRLPGHYRFTPLKDLATVIEWAKVRRIRPDRWLPDGGDRASIPPDLFARVYTDYERAKTRAGFLDFEDMLVETVELLETDEAAADLVRRRKTWLSVDEYQDTNPLQERLLELWLGASRDLAVVGDPDQTIYTFTGASPEFLLRFAQRHAGARTVALVENYRSTPQVLDLANRLVGVGPRGPLGATRPAGPRPTIQRFRDGDAELDALIAGIRRRIAEGTAPGEIAVLLRINAQLPEIEQALTRAGVAFRVTGQRFFERREVHDARSMLGKADLSARGAALATAIERLFTERLGLGDDTEGAGEEARERMASLELLLTVVGDLTAADPQLSVADVLADFDRRAAEEAAGSGKGVNLLTYHKAKGLEWDAVFLPSLEEGLLPIRQARDPESIAEERRLLYVGITRARVHLWLSSAERRTLPGGKETRREPSRFLAALQPQQQPGLRGAVRATNRDSAGDPDRAATSVRQTIASAAGDPGDRDGHLLQALQVWRLNRARTDGVPAYVVAHDSLLFAITDARPRSLEALVRIKGMGTTKLERYGDDILKIVAAAA